MQLYLIRHGQSESNARWAKNPEDPFHIPDPGLTDTGKKQAAALGRHLAEKHQGVLTHRHDPANRLGFGITRIYTSLMRRALETAECISEALDLPMHASTSMHEWGGLYEWNPATDDRKGLPGHNRAYFEERYPRLVLPRDFNEDGWWSRPYETHRQAYIRAKTTLNEMLIKYRGTKERIAVVCHGGFINMVLRSYLQMPDDLVMENLFEENRWFVMLNTSITRFDVTEGFYGVIYANRAEHLPDELIT